MSDRTPAQDDWHLLLRIEIPKALYEQLEAIAEEDGDTVEALVHRAIGNLVHNRTLD